MISKFLDPKNDFAFKKIFGTEKNKDILIHFINDMLTFKGGHPIEDVTFLKTDQNPDIAIYKMSIVDVLCRDKYGNQYIVEMQVAKDRGFEKRAQYYASKAYISQSCVGDQYHHLREVIFVAIADFIIFPKKKAFKSDHVILDLDTHEHDLKDFSFTFLELPKFKKNIDELHNIVDKWMYFFKHAAETKEKDLSKLVGQDQILERAYEELNCCSWNEVELRTYDQERKYISVYHGQMAQKFDEGIEKGKAEGREEGRLEERIDMAKAMHMKGIKLDAIGDITGLSEDELRKILSSSGLK